MDKIIIHSKFQIKHLDKKYHNKIVWIPHQNYCSILTSDIKQKNNFFLFFGSINPYKGVETAIKAYKNIETFASFKIIGKISDDKYKVLLNNLSCDNKSITIEDRYIDDAELEVLVRESNTVLLPFAQITNSGSLLYALSCRTNVIMKKSTLTDELHEEYENLDKALFTFETEEELSSILKSSLIYNTSNFDDFIEKTNMNNLVDKYLKVMR
ncbi:MAG: glycosyltransferase [Colwellia sp.]|nr:glycosyltransferase [Colwellia sp.]